MKVSKKCSLLILLCMLVTLCFPLEVFVQPSYASSPSIEIERVYTNQSRYNPGDLVEITVQVSNHSGAAWNDYIQLTIYHLEQIVHTDSQLLSLNHDDSAQLYFTWSPPLTDYQGYFVHVTADEGVSAATAIDVSSQFTKYPRYGYVSEMSANETNQQSIAKINELAEDYHINAWQFYDWMWRHEKVIKRTGSLIDPTWIDLFNREIAWQTLQNQIAAIHQQNGAAMGYAMVYHAREGYSAYGVDPSWGLYNDPYGVSQHDFNFGFGPILFFFDPMNLQWQQHIFDEYLDMINTAGFDGIHVDQMGQRDFLYDASGNMVDLSLRFSPFLNAAKTRLTQNDPTRNHITFNMVDGTVNGWGVNDISTHANVDFLYSEIWHLADSYIELKDYIDSIRANSGNKAVVLASYMNYKENIGPRYEAEDALLTNVSVNNNHSGYTGSGFVDQFVDVGDAVTFTIHAPDDGYYSLVLRHGNHTYSDATRNLYIDDELETQLSFHWMDSWDKWSTEVYHQVYLTAGEHEIKLAYDADNTGAINLDHLTLGTFDDHSIRLVNAMAAASGATRIELGEDSQMLAHEYYPNRSKSVRKTLKQAMKHHYNFITAYENLLFDAEVLNNDSGNQFISIDGVPTSGDGAGNTVWHIIKRSPDYQVVHLINLLNNDNQWRNQASEPTSLTNLQTKVYIGADETISNVYVASPDLHDGVTKELSFTTGQDLKGKYVAFTLPDLRYWNMIYMKRSFTAPVNHQYEAEAAIKTNVSTNDNHPGFTGSGFVDAFGSPNSGVSFVVDAETDDDYVLGFRYSNGGSPASRDVYIDGKFAGKVQFNSTGSWDTWAYGELTTHLTPGTHSVVLWYNSSNAGAINLDHLTLEKTYVWQFDRQISSVPEGYRITFRVGLPGWLHWGTDNWQNIQDTAFAPNGSSQPDLDYEISIGPFVSSTEVNFTFLWDDNLNGIPEYNDDRWEGTDFNISIP